PFPVRRAETCTVADTRSTFGMCAARAPAESDRERGLAVEQAALDRQAPGEAAERPVGAQHAMAGHEQCGSIAGADGCRGADRLRAAQRDGELAVRERAARADAALCGPAGVLQRGAVLAHG